MRRTCWWKRHQVIDRLLEEISVLKPSHIARRPNSAISPEDELRRAIYGVSESSRRPPRAEKQGRKRTPPKRADESAVADGRHQR